MLDFLNEHFPNVIDMRSGLLDAVWETLVMVGVSGAFGIVLGTLLALLLVITTKGGLYENRYINGIFGKVINTFRSIPFVVLIALLVPFTRFVVGTSIGVSGAIVPMVIGIVPFIARLVEQALLEIDKGVIEAARAMGISRPYIIFHVMLREALPGVLRALVTGLVSLISLSAMAGIVGGGGLGSFAIRFGYQRFMNDITIVTVVLLLLMVNIVQGVGDRLAAKMTH